MKKHKIIRITAAVILLLFVFQAGVFAYSKLVTPAVVIDSGGNNPIEVAAANNILLSSKPLQSAVVHITFGQFLKELSVQQAYQQEIKQLTTQGYSLQDICIAYDFLYQNFGSKSDWEELLASKQAGKTWEELFNAYTLKQSKFEPRSFDSEELESLMKSPNFTSDDIMIADRLSFVTGKPIKDLISERMQTGSWSDIFVSENILYSGNKLPRVQITEDQIQTYMQPGEFSEQEVTWAFVLAQKVGESPEIVIAKLKAGSSEALIMAQGYMEKYAE